MLEQETTASDPASLVLLVLPGPACHCNVMSFNTMSATASAIDRCTGAMQQQPIEGNPIQDAYPTHTGMLCSMLWQASSAALQIAV